MHHLVVDRWSRGSSPLHARHAQAKMLVLLGLLVALSTTASGAPAAFGGYAAILAAAAALSGLPFGGLLARAALVLPFSATFAAVTWWSGDSARALALIAKSYLSGLAVLLFIATTPLTETVAVLERRGCPRPLLLVVQFLYRYLFVVAEQVLRMRQAALCRRGQGRGGFRCAAGMLAALFARSWQRAEGVHHAMLARGFRGRFVITLVKPFRAADILFVGAALAACGAVRFLL